MGQGGHHDGGCYYHADVAKKITEHMLADGDKILIGTRLYFKFCYQDTVEQNYQQNLFRAANIDALTQLYNKKYFVDVLSKEFSFSRRNKTSRHPHTNMAKAGLNMLTRTIAEAYARDGIHVTSVDTGWVTDERPQGTKEAYHEAGFRVPLDVVDGAARVYDPIVRGVHGDRISGVFLKDYQVVPW
jgi:NAD(P)-dependent dehydrogenase (short-subunit alcohol dehydrogenase family)